jgi:hypothetical protein
VPPSSGAPGAANGLISELFGVKSGPLLQRSNIILGLAAFGCLPLVSIRWVLCVCGGGGSGEEQGSGTVDLAREVYRRGMTRGGLMWQESEGHMTYRFFGVPQLQP